MPTLLFRFSASPYLFIIAHTYSGISDAAKNRKKLFVFELCDLYVYSMNRVTLFKHDTQY